MKTLWPTIRQLLDDTLVPLPVGYYLLLHDDCLQLLRVSPVSTRLIYEATYGGDCLVGIDEFLAWYSAHLNSGQPVAVLLNCQSFVLVRRAEKLTPDLALKAIKTVQTDSAILNFVSAKNKDASWLVVQGINRQFRQALGEKLETALVPVLFMQTLTSYLVATTRLLSDQARFSVCRWSAKKATFLGVNERGEAFDGQLPFGQTIDTAALESLKASYLPETTGVPVVAVATSLGTQTKPLTKVFSSRPSFERKYRPLQARVTSSTSARMCLVATNSLKLFNIITVTVLLFCLVAAGGFNWARSASAEQVATYQKLYSQRLALERQMESLAQIESGKQRTESSTEAAALLAAFCQQPAEVKLASISLRQAKDTFLCDVVGRADDDMAVFGYIDALMPLVDPWAVRLASLRPEIVTIEGRQDTVLSFKLIVTQELHAQK